MEKLTNYTDIKNSSKRNENAKTNDNSNRRNNKIIRWITYSYNGSTVSIHTNSNEDSTNLNMKEANNEEVLDNKMQQLNIHDITRDTKNKTDNEIKEMIKQKLEFVEEEHPLILKQDSVSNKDESSNIISKFDESTDPFNIENRRKYSKLSLDQINYLKQKIVENKDNVSSLSRAYHVTPSTLSKIKNTDDMSLWKLPRRRFVKVHQKERSLIKDAIEKYYWEQLHPFTINDILKHLKQENNIDCPYKLIRKIVKDNVKLSYKRSLSRPIIANIKRVKILRCLFSIQISQEIKSDVLIINWDEWSINRHTKLNFSWSKVGLNKEVKNSSFVGSTSMIMAILSNGCWFSMLTNDKTNSKIFIHFIIKLNKWLESNNMFEYKYIHLHLDNCPYHKSMETIDYFRRTSMKIFFLPPYSPSLAPIEMVFGWIKYMLKLKSIRSKLYLNSKEASIKIFDVIK